MAYEIVVMTEEGMTKVHPDCIEQWVEDMGICSDLVHYWADVTRDRQGNRWMRPHRAKWRCSTL